MRFLFTLFLKPPVDSQDCRTWAFRLAPTARPIDRGAQESACAHVSRSPGETSSRCVASGSHTTGSLDAQTHGIILWCAVIAFSDACLFAEPASGFFICCHLRTECR